jgi:hypothetical protein
MMKLWRTGADLGISAVRPAQYQREEADPGYRVQQGQEP